MIVHVALPIPIGKSLSYSVPDPWLPFVQTFVRVKVPLTRSTLTGFVTAVDFGNDEGLKPVIEVEDPFPLVDPELARLAEWASYYYVTPMGLVLKYALPATLRYEKYLKIEAFSEDLRAVHGLPFKKAIALLGKEALLGHYHDGVIGFRDILTDRPFSPFEKSSVPRCASSGKLVAGDIETRLRYYMDAIAEHLARGENVLVLVPDYHVTGSYFRDRLGTRFPGRIRWYGSSVKAKERMETYLRVRNEGGSVILGNKSCLFLPICREGLIIVERPEDDGYRNEEGFKFNAVTVVLKRAEMAGIPIVLGSASPPVEIFKQVSDGALTLVGGDLSKPLLHREVVMETGISSTGALPEELVDIVAAAVERKDRIAIYTPRKDYGSHLKCLDCKALFVCPVCKGALTYQKWRESLMCTGCGKVLEYEERCVQCGSNLIRFSNVGAEYIEEKVKEIFKHVPVFRITGDTLREKVKELSCLPGDAPAVLIGTQAMSKLYGFRAARLAMVEWEELRRVGGYRAGEKMFQILHNLLDALEPDEVDFFMARKKRVDLEGFLNFKLFYDDELEKRRIAGFPPYLRIFLLEVERVSEARGAALVEKIRAIVSARGLSEHVMGPLIQKRRKYRWRMMLKGDEKLLFEALREIRDLPGVRVEGDPVNM